MKTTGINGMLGPQFRVSMQHGLRGRNLMQAISGALGWVFFALYKADLSGSGKGYNRWKALVVLTVLECSLLASADLWLEMYSGHSLFLGSPKIVIAVVYAVAFLANHSAFLRGDRSDRLLEAMGRRAPRDRGVRLSLAWLFILGVLALLVFSFSQFGIWAAARQ
jgi:hypothetical protein